MTDNTINRPIAGDITRRERNTVEQGTVEEFLKDIDAVLSVPGVEAVRWEQYTPYFNDGDPCEFTVYDLNVKFIGHDEEGDYEDGYLDNWTLRSSEWRPSWITDDISALIPNVNLSRYENILQDNFGDHAQVTATLEGFNVEYYEHD